MIHVENIGKIFRVHKKEPGIKGSIKSLFNRQWLDKEALKNVSLDISAGEIVGLVGANGAGKTTLIKILSGIIYPTSGEASVLGYLPWERKNSFRRHIALIMGQKAQLWWDLPALDCFLLLREIYQIPKKNYNERLDFLIHTLEVGDLLKIQVRRLSLGERMKMELIAALLHQPKVVFFDEPTIGLDLTAQRAIRNFILQYRTNHNPAMILTSHYMEDIERLCKRIIIIREGQIVYDGELEKIVSLYARHKVIGARITKDNNIDDKVFSSLESYGKILEKNCQFVKLKVIRNQVANATSFILQNFPVLDLNIEEEDIGTLIEAIQKGPGHDKERVDPVGY